MDDGRFEGGVEGAIVELTPPKSPEGGLVKRLLHYINLGLNVLFVNLLITRRRRDWKKQLNLISLYVSHAI
jgi:hypothetical protein